jgi:hypothetical protein
MVVTQGLHQQPQLKQLVQTLSVQALTHVKAKALVAAQQIVVQVKTAVKVKAGLKQVLQAVLRKAERMAAKLSLLHSYKNTRTEISYRVFF